MANDTAARRTGQRITRPGSQELEVAKAAQAGSEFQWHYGRVTRMGIFEVAESNTRDITILWEEGGIISQQGNITDAQWEIFKLAFLGSGRIAVLSDQEDQDWMYDYRFLEAVR